MSPGISQKEDRRSVNRTTPTAVRTIANKRAIAAHRQRSISMKIKITKKTILAIAGRAGAKCASTCSID